MAAEISPITTEDLQLAGLPEGLKMNSGLALLFNNQLYERCKNVAAAMSKAAGFMPDHLIGKEATCFAVISLSIGWNLNPYMVARSTYTTPGGSIGFEGKLVQAILENSGAVEGRIEFDHFGSWSNIMGKFRMETSVKNAKMRYPVQTWKDEDEDGLGVKVIANIRGEAVPRTEEFLLREFHPRNSTLWALRPKQQICYAAVRAFANIAAPGLMMGVPFDIDPTGFYGEPMDINERPGRGTAKASPFTREQTADVVQNQDLAKEPATPAEPHGEAGSGAVVDASQTDGRPAEGGQVADGERAAGEEASAEGEPADETVDEGSLPAVGSSDPAESEAAEELPPATVRIRLQKMLEEQSRVGDVADLMNDGKSMLPPEMHGAWEKACEDKISAIVMKPSAGGRGRR